MPPFKRLPIACAVCGTSLTGGLDTYGDVGAEVCQEHYLNPPDAEPDPLLKAEHDDAVRELERQIEDINIDLFEKRGDLEDLQGEIAVLESERSALQDQLDDLHNEWRDRMHVKLERWKAVSS